MPTRFVNRSAKVSPSIPMIAAAKPAEEPPELTENPPDPAAIGAGAVGDVRPGVEGLPPASLVEVIDGGGGLIPSSRLCSDISGCDGRTNTAWAPMRGRGAPVGLLISVGTSSGVA